MSPDFLRALFWKSDAPYRWSSFPTNAYSVEYVRNIDFALLREDPRPELPDDHPFARLDMVGGQPERVVFILHKKRIGIGWAYWIMHGDIMIVEPFHENDLPTLYKRKPADVQHPGHLAAADAG